MIAGAIESARPVFEGFNDHGRVASRAIEHLAADVRVAGLYLSGSFAKGKPDRWSDNDLPISSSATSSRPPTWYSSTCRRTDNAVWD
jgi:hypothetical protein